MAAHTKNVRNFRMKAVRINNGNLTQKQAAAKMGFTTQYYSRVERGMIDGCIDFWRHFAEAFKIPDSDVWEIVTNQPNKPQRQTIAFDETIAQREQIPT